MMARSHEIDASPEQTQRTADRTDALIGRLFQAALGTMDVFSIFLGDRLGLYRSLAEHGPTTAAALAQRTGTRALYP